MFRMSRYAPDYEGLAGHSLRPRDPIEQQTPVLYANGATIPTWVHVGSSVALNVRAVADAGQPYLVGTSMTPGVVPIDYRFLRVGLDQLLIDSMTNVFPTTFQGYVGWLDAQGTAKALLQIPPQPGLAGIVLHSTFMVLDLAAPHGVRTMANDAIVQIVP
jgi:hypothetical protein